MADDFWYRMWDGRTAPPVDEYGLPIGRGSSHVYSDSFRVVRKTPKGVWLDVYGYEKFVLSDARKRWAYPTREEALKSFRARKHRQLEILRAQIRHVEAVLNEAGDTNRWANANSEEAW